MSTPAQTAAWVTVDMRDVRLGRRTADWWTAFQARTPGRTFSDGRYRIPYDSRETAAQAVALLAAFGIPKNALTVGGGQ